MQAESRQQTSAKFRSSGALRAVRPGRSLSGAPGDRRRPRALIIDRRAVLATDVCRQLGRLQWQVDILGEKNSPAFRSRYCHGRIVSPACDCGAPFLDLLAEVVEKEKYDAIFLCSEEILELILPLVSSGAEWSALPLSRPESLRIALSKKLSTELAAGNGVPIPTTVIPTSDGEVQSMGANLGFPHVVKGEKGEASQNVRVVMRAEEMLAQYAQVARKEAKYGERPFLQEFIPGVEYSVGGLFCDGEPLRIYAYRKLFTYPINGGISAKAVTERPSKLLESACAIFGALRYTGLGQVQFIHDSRDGQFKFLEINPRVWGCFGLAQRAGVDLYTPHRALARGERVKADLRFREGVEYHRFSIELRLCTRRPLHLFRFIRDCIDPRVRSDFEWSDPGPHFPTLHGLKRLFQR
jgi:predicted ATP-grasp superfamily ATP-dependent carboligase